MENLIQNTRHQTANQQYKILLYGQAGIGKTTIIPTLTNPIIVLVEDGNALISLSNFDLPYINVVHETKKFNEQQPKQNHISEFEMLIRVLNWLKTTEIFNTIVIDSISEVSISDVDGLLKGKSNNGNKIHGQQAYGQLLYDFGTLFDVLNQCRQDIVCMGKQMRYQTEDGEKFFPLFAGKALAPLMEHRFDGIVSFEKDMQGNKYFRTTSNYQYFAKVRSAVPLQEKEPPHLGQLLNKIRGVNNG